MTRVSESFSLDRFRKTRIPELNCVVILNIELMLLILI